MKLTNAEKKWLSDLSLLLSQAPKGINQKLDALTIGDPNIVIYDKKKLEEYEEMMGIADPVCGNLNGRLRNMDEIEKVSKSEAEIITLDFPFNIHSTSG